MGTLRKWLPACVVLSVPMTLLGQAPPLGGEFQVNSFTTGIQYSTRVAVNRTGDFVLVWQSFNQDGDGYGVFGQRFDDLGVAVGTEFPVNTYTSGWQYYPSVALDDAGKFVAVWQSNFQQAIIGQRFDATGAKIGSEFQVNTYLTGFKQYPRVAGNGAGGFVVVWQDDSRDGSGNGVVGQRFDGSGSKVGGEFAVNTYTTGDQILPQVAVDPSGNFVVVWQSSGQDGDGDGVFAQRFDGSGVKVGPEFRLNTFTTGSQQRPSVSTDHAGNFVVVWQSDGQDGDGKAVVGQRFDSSGEKVGPEFLVNTYTPKDQSDPSVAMDEKGGFVVVWSSLGQEGVFLTRGVFGQRFDKSGARIGAEFPINTYTTDNQNLQQIAMDGSGDVVIAWDSCCQDGASFGAFARRSNVSPRPMAVDAHDTSGSVSDANGVLEPGETVEIAPSWTIIAGSDIPTPVALTGTASNLTGAFGGAIDQTAADYGESLPGSPTNCYDATAGHSCYLLHVDALNPRPATHVDETFDEAPSLGGVKTWTLHVGDSFTDVPRSQTFYKKIETMLHHGITAGCTTTTYCPDMLVSRGQMAIFIGKGIAGSGEYVPTTGVINGQAYDCSPGGVSRFTDVAPTDSFCRHVHYLAAQNVTLGCDATHYCPGQTITRDTMASFIAKAIVAPKGGVAVPASYTDPTTARSYSCVSGSANLHFADVPLSNAFCKHIHYLWAKGVVDGCTATTYCPGSPVARDAMAKFIANGFGLQLYGP